MTLDEQKMLWINSKGILNVFESFKWYIAHTQDLHLKMRLQEVNLCLEKALKIIEDNFKEDIQQGIDPYVKNYRKVQ